MAKPDSSPLVVGIGTSAKGLDALRSFFSTVPEDPEMAFVVVQHLAPDHTSRLIEILRDATSLPVESADENVEVETNHVYVIAPGDQLSFRDGKLRTESIPEIDGARHTIDFFFRSIAEELGEQAVGIVLSGAGSDGTAGLQLIKRHGGLTMVQEPEDAGVDMMPRSAIQEGAADVVAPANELCEKLIEVTRTHRRYGYLSQPGELDDDKTATLLAVLRELRERTGNDLSTYKRPTVLRRIGRRMQIHQLSSIDEYWDYLQAHDEEFEALFDELLIKVTGFFRDLDAWLALRDQVLPSLLEDRDVEEPIRVWVPGCSTGEEAYTVAMLLRHYVDELESRPSVKVFATDVDRNAIKQARSSVYPATVASDIPPEYLARYFHVDDGQYRVVDEIRNMIMFAPQNVLSDPPFSKLDLITCRNLLIYLQPDAQSRLLRLLHYGLVDGGILMLGSSETPSQSPDLFENLNDKHHIYRAKSASSHPDVVPGTAFGFDVHVTGNETEELASTEPSVDLESVHRETLVASYDLASVLVDENHAMLHAMGDTENYLSVPTGEPTDDLLAMVADYLRPSVRTLLFEAAKDLSTEHVRRVSEDAESGRPAIEIRARAIDPDDAGETYIGVSFRPSDEDFPQAHGESEDAADQTSVVEQYELELEQTRTQLEETVRDYEEANEQLRASNEELMSMNEELQSTTEELQTSKEELQSMNEELQTVNQELNEKIRQLDAVNSDLRNLMRATNIGTLFLDRELNIERFTSPVTDLFNITAKDEGRPVGHLTHSLQTDSIVEDAKRVVDEVTTVEREVQSDDGRWFLVRTLPYLNLDDRVEGAVVTLINITDRRRAQEKLVENEEKFRTIFESAADMMFIYRINEEGRPQPFMETNSAAIEALGVAPSRLETMTIDDVLGGPDFDLDTHLQAVCSGGEVVERADLTVGDDEPSVPVEVTGTRLEIGDRMAIAEIVRDISNQQRYEQALIESKERAEELAELRSMFMSTLSHDVRSPLSVILTTAGMLQQQVDAESTDMVERIQRSCRQLRRILDSILRMAKLESNEANPVAESFDIVAKVKDVVDLYVPLANSQNINLEYDGSDASVYVGLDPQFLVQILNNLIDNAIKFTDEGDITVRLNVVDDKVEIDVVDTGRGIEHDELERLFRRFQTGDDVARYDSSGLGLAIARLLVESMEGDISIKSTSNKGTTFSVSLPRELASHAAN
jgi:two-component system CheB/CheR fusion protein